MDRCAICSLHQYAFACIRLFLRNESGESKTEEKIEKGQKMVSINNLSHPGILPCLVINITFWIAGGVMLIFPPKKINGIYGYRTSKSMKNQVNWNFAQKYSAQRMIQFSTISTVLSLLLFLFDASGNWATLVGMAVSILGIILVFYHTEKALSQL